MGRNSELIRQWTILQRIATARGQTIPKLATDLSVSTRTIRRDLEALQVAGFPVYDEIVHGAKFWRLDARAMGALARTGLTLSELAALYFSRALIECFAGTALRKDITSVFDKLEAVLSPAMKKFLDRLPARYLGEARTCEAPGRAHLRDHGSAARRHSRPTRNLDAVSLPREPAPEAVHRAPVPFDPRAGRPVSHRLRAGVRRGADVCRRAHQQSERAGDDVRTDRGA